MTADLVLAAGGLGLFLLGMVILTDGLKDIAGPALRRLLVRFTDTPTRGAMAGAFTTAVIQSSSATTVMTVGFVGAGLLTFSQGLGVIFGANVGTTITGWIVALVGFKLKLGTVAMALLPLAILLRLFANGRWRQVGWALAGFSLLFMGLDAMKTGMAPFESAITPADFPSDSLWGRLQLVAIGMAITIVTQSSSAGVASTLVALHTGAIDLAQAAALVIGMDVGTTATAALATLGGSDATRRTGYAHVTYNVITGVSAVALLGPLLWLVTQVWPDTPEVALVAFHTTFNVLGVIIVLPLTPLFARMMMRLVPERGPVLLRRLDERLLADPHAAVDASAATVSDIAARLLKVLEGLLDPARPAWPPATEMAAIRRALDATGDYMEKIRRDPADARARARQQTVLHAVDHLYRMSYRCEQADRIAALSESPWLRRPAALICTVCTRLMREATDPALGERLARIVALLEQRQQSYRARVVDEAARGDIDMDRGLDRMDAMRWLARMAYHLLRLHLHLRVLVGDPAAGAAPVPEAAEAKSG